MHRNKIYTTKSLQKAGSKEMEAAEGYLNKA